MSTRTFVAFALAGLSAAAFAAAGDPDLTYGNAGKLLIRIGSTADATGLTAAALDNAGNLYAAASNNESGAYDVYVVKLDSSAHSITSYGTGGAAVGNNGGLNAYASGLALSSTGEASVSVNVYNSGVYSAGLTRFTSSGAADATYNGGNISAGCYMSTSCGVYALVQDSHGNLFDIGYGDAITGAIAFYLSLEYDAASSTWASPGGSVLTSVNSTSHDTAYAGAADSAGNIYAAGFTNAGGSDDFLVEKFSPSGALVTAFGTQGKVLVDIGSASDDVAYAMALDGGGNIYVAGTSNSAGPYNFAVIKLKPDGTLDTTFAAGGKLVLPLYGYAVSMAFDGRGNLYVAGTTNVHGSDDFAVVEIDSHGVPVPSFGFGSGNVSGVSTVDFGVSSTDDASALVIDPSGKIYVVGKTNAPGNQDGAIVRLQSNPVDSISAGNFE